MELLVFVNRFRISILAETRMNGNQLTEYMEFWETKKTVGAMAPVILLSIVQMEMLKNNLILFFNITQNSFTNFNLLPNIEALIAKRLPLHEGAFSMFTNALSIFLTSTDLIKDIFSRKRKPARVILSGA